MEKNYTPRGVVIVLAKAVFYLALWFVLQILAVNLVAVIITAKSPGIDDVTLNTTLNGLMAQITVLTGCLVILALAIIAKLKNDTLSRRAYINKYPPQFTISLLIMGIVTAYAVALILGLAEMAKIIPDSWLSTQEKTYTGVNSASVFMQFLSVGLIGPISEELLFRGAILGGLKKEMHPWAAIVVSALIFGIAHGTPLGIIYASALGILMGWLFVTFDSVVPPIILHVAYNCTQSFSEGIYLPIAVLSIPILVFEIVSITKYFRGKNK